MKYLRYIGMPLLIIISIWFGAKGMYWAWVYLLILDTIIIAGDAFFGDDTSVPEYRYPELLTLLVYINLPLYLIFLAIAVYMGGNASLPWFEQFVFSLTGVDIIAAREGTVLWHLGGFVFAGGLLMGSAVTVPAHELVHHKKKRLDWAIGNFMMAFTCDGSFAVEHVHGHHKNVGLASDPATAKQGASPYSFFIKATIQEHKDGWQIEMGRLRKRGYAILGLHNRVLQGYVLSLLVALGTYYIGGIGGLLIFLGIAVFAKFFLETVNFMEHYGLVRVPGTPVAHRHSWNTNKRVSSILLYNLTRHSHHHEQGSLEFWKLRPYPNAPEMPYGYLTTLYLVAFFPWAYRRMMEPKLEEWRNHFATESEKGLMVQSRVQ